MRLRFVLGWFSVLCLFHTTALHAQVPQLINYQGRVVVGTTNFSGTGQFKFALMNNANGQTLWSNDGTSTNGSQPTSAVSISVNNGLYSVLLGATSPIPTLTVFNNSDVRLRVWFNDGSHGSQLLSPDQRIGSVGYAFLSAGVGDTSTGAIAYTTGNQLRLEAPGGIKLQTEGSGTGVTLTTASIGGVHELDVAGKLYATGSIGADVVNAAIDLNAGHVAAGYINIGSGNGTNIVLDAAGGANFTGSISLPSTYLGFDGSAQFAGNVQAQSFTPTSDRNAKERFRPVNAREILSHLAGVPIQTWNFKHGDAGVQHIGPMAQDFYAAFQVGPDEKHIATVDADGVAFAAIQGLNEIVQEQNAELAAKAKKIDALERRLDELEKTLRRKNKNKSK
jgi:hypothetical protein